MAAGDPVKPAGFEDDLGGWGVLLFDSGCGEPVAWGWKLLHRMDERRFAELRNHGELQCLSRDGEWGLATHELTRDEAVKKYGPITEEVRGPRGGWKSVTFGTRKFLSKSLSK